MYLFILYESMNHWKCISVKFCEIGHFWKISRNRLVGCS